MNKKLLEIILLGCLATNGYSGDLLTSEELAKKLDNKAALTQKQHNERRKYALILNGDYSDLHKGNVTESYNSLKYLGFEDNNIYLLSSNSPRTETNQTISAHATRENLPKIIEHLEKRVDNNDLLVIYMTGHGSRGIDESTLILEKYEPTQKELKQYFSRVKAKDYVVVCDQCYSGGVAKELSTLEGNVVAYSSVDEKNVTVCESFARPFWESFRNGKADKNKDGTTTLDEAYNYAARIHENSATPDDDDCVRKAHQFKTKNYPKEI